MNHEELETLLRTHPALTPSLDLEARIVRATRPRFRGWIPAAAALIFCVGVVGGVISTIGGKGKPEGPLMIRFEQKDGSWIVRPPDIFAAVRHAKERGVVLIGPDATPWALVQSVRQACAQAGIERTEWRVGERVLEAPTHGPPPPPWNSLTIRLEEIRAVLRRPPGTDATVRRIGSRPPVATDDDLMAIILRMAVDYRRAGKVVTDVYIDGGPNIPWGEIAVLIEKCRAGGIDLIYPDVPQEPVRYEDTHVRPDKRLYPPLKD